MADIILDLRALKSKADAAGCGTSATNNTPSLCPAKGNIAGYVTGGSTVVSIQRSYANNQLVAAKDVSISKLSRTLSFITVVSSIEYGDVGTIVATPSAGAGDGTITYTSSNSNVVYIQNGNQVRATASCSTSGSTCTITATISAGTYYKSASCSYTITGYNRYNGNTPIDLGLTSGTKWSFYGVSTSGKVNPWTYAMYTKYGRTDNYAYSQADYTGTENPLSYANDAARKYLGGLWHIPTRDQWQELIDQTTRTWTTMNSSGQLGAGGIYGVKFTNKKDSSKYIFLPACGYYNQYGNLDGNRGVDGGQGRYWSSTPYNGKFANFVISKLGQFVQTQDKFGGLGIWACVG